jgi:sec-independent protein translocase protein TatA
VGPIGFQEIVVIMLLALIFLGPKKLPELASGIGKAIREVRKATADIKQEIELDEIIRKPLEELREATMLPPEELKRRDEDRKWRERMEREERERQAREVGNGVTDGSAASDAVASGSEYDHSDLPLDPSSVAAPAQASSSGLDDPQAHAPDSTTHSASAEAALSPKAEAGPAAWPSIPGTPPGTPPATIDGAIAPASIPDLPPPRPAVPHAAAPAAARRAASTGATKERTVAMALPPPMGGSTSTPSLPPPSPVGARRVTPPPVPAAALKAPGESSAAPAGAVPRVGSGGATLLGMPLPAPAPRPAADEPTQPTVQEAAAPPDHAGSTLTPSESKGVVKTAGKPTGKASKKA